MCCCCSELEFDTGLWCLYIYLADRGHYGTHTCDLCELHTSMTILAPTKLWFRQKSLLVPGFQIKELPGTNRRAVRVKLHPHRQTRSFIGHVL